MTFWQGFALGITAYTAFAAARWIGRRRGA